MPPLSDHYFEPIVAHEDEDVDNSCDGPFLQPSPLLFTKPTFSAPESQTYTRPLGDNELSYFLPSRDDGVNDMYLHIGFQAKTGFVNPRRVSIAWAIIRVRHPLLAARVLMTKGAYDTATFAYTPPATPREAVHNASANLETRIGLEKDHLIDAYLNGPRTLSNNRLSYLILSSPARDNDNDQDIDASEPSSPATPALSTSSSILSLETPSPSDSFSSRGEDDVVQEYDMMLCATHFLGDGIALHATMNDLFTLLASSSPSDEGGVLSDDDLYDLLDEEWSKRWDQDQTWIEVNGGFGLSMKGLVVENAPIPPAIESMLPLPKTKFQALAQKVDFKTSQNRLIGGHIFPRAQSSTRHTVVPTTSFDTITTKAIINKCKIHGVTVSHALFALCNFAWIRTRTARRMDTEAQKLPMMIYSALNLRPYLPPTPSPLNVPPSFWFLAVGYFNIILPSFIPSSVAPEAIFWHRAKRAKTQSAKYTKSPMLVGRSREMCTERAARAKGWAKDDDAVAIAAERNLDINVDEVDAGLKAIALSPVSPPPNTPAPSPVPATATIPSSALLGLSLLGNLDATYTHTLFAPSGLILHTLTTGSRQRKGGMLLFGYTFASKLWLSLGWDVLGFEEGIVEAFWEEVLNGVEEFLGE